MLFSMCLAPTMLATKEAVRSLPPRPKVVTSPWIERPTKPSMTTMSTSLASAKAEVKRLAIKDRAENIGQHVRAGRLQEAHAPNDVPLVVDADHVCRIERVELIEFAPVLDVHFPAQAIPEHACSQLEHLIQDVFELMLVDAINNDDHSIPLQFGYRKEQINQVSKQDYWGYPVFFCLNC